MPAFELLQKRSSMRFSISWKLALFTSLLSLISIITLVSVSYTKSLQLLDNEINIRLKTTATLRAQQIGDRIDDMLQNMNLTASRVLTLSYLQNYYYYNNLTSREYNMGNHDLYSAIESTTLFPAAKYVSLAGNTIFSANTTPVTAGMQSLFDSLNGSTTVEWTIPLNDSGVYKMGVQMPILSANQNSTISYLRVVLLAEEFQELLHDNYGLGVLGRLLIVKQVDPSNYIFVLPPLYGDQYMGKTWSIADYPPILDANPKITNSMVLNNNQDNKTVIVSYLQLSKSGWIVISELNQAEAMAPILALRLMIFTASGTTVLVCLVLSFLFARIVTLPITQLAKVTHDLQKGKMDSRIVLKKSRVPDEINELQEAFNAMVDELSNVYNMLEQKVLDRTKELEAARKNADAASNAKSLFLANMSHEIRTPLQQILGIAALCLQDASVKDDVRYILGLLKSAGDHLLNLVNDILDYSKIEAGRLEIVAIPFTLAHIKAQLSSMFSLVAKQKGIELIVDVDPELPDKLIGDPHRLLQVLINLTGNAIKFTSQGKVTITLAIDPIERVPNDILIKLQCKVQDTGMGIPKDKQHLLFQSFSQVDGSYTRQFGGTGLGLAISLKIVQMMNGTMWIESDTGKGSTFFFTIQVVKDNSSQLLARIDTTKILRQPLYILLVEDNHINQLVARRMLEKLGHKIVTASNGLEAIQAYESNGNLDLVFMDVQMPICDGLEATRQIRQKEILNGITPKPIVAMTAHVFSADLENCIRAGMDTYVTKPFEISRLSEVIDELIYTV